MTILRPIQDFPKLAYLEEQLRDRRVLLLGHAPGEVAQQLSRLTSDFLLVDPSEMRLRFACHRYGLSADQVLQADWDQTGLPSGNFDVILALCPAIDPDRWGSTLAELQRVLSPDGLLVISLYGSRPLAARSLATYRVWTLDAVKDLLSPHFASVEVLVQQTGLGIQIGHPRPSAEVFFLPPRDDGPPPATEFMALCSSLDLVVEDHMVATWSASPLLQWVYSRGRKQGTAERTEAGIEAGTEAALATAAAAANREKEALAAAGAAADREAAASQEVARLSEALEDTREELALKAEREKLLELRLEETRGALEVAEEIRLEMAGLIQRLRLEKQYRSAQPDISSGRSTDPEAHRVAEAPEGGFGGNGGAAYDPRQQRYDQSLAREQLRAWMLEEQVQTLQDLLKRSVVDLPDPAAAPRDVLPPENSPGSTPGLATPASPLPSPPIRTDLSSLSEAGGTVSLPLLAASSALEDHGQLRSEETLFPGELEVARNEALPARARTLPIRLSDPYGLQDHQEPSSDVGNEQDLEPEPDEDSSVDLPAPDPGSPFVMPGPTAELQRALLEDWDRSPAGSGPTSTIAARWRLPERENTGAETRAEATLRLALQSAALTSLPSVTRSETESDPTATDVQGRIRRAQELTLEEPLEKALEGYDRAGAPASPMERESTSPTEVSTGSGDGGAGQESPEHAGTNQDGGETPEVPSGTMRRLLNRLWK